MYGKFTSFDTFVASFLLIVSMIAILVAVVGQPIVFKTEEGTVCGCLVDEDVPAKAQCKKVNFLKPYQVIYVSHC
jgi:hypothetical protein